MCVCVCLPCRAVPCRARVQREGCFFLSALTESAQLLSDIFRPRDVRVCALVVRVQVRYGLAS